MNITFLSETAVGYEVLLHLMCCISPLSTDTLSQNSCSESNEGKDVCVKFSTLDGNKMFEKAGSHSMLRQ